MWHHILINYLGGDERDRLRSAHGSKYDQLAALKPDTILRISSV